MKKLILFPLIFLSALSAFSQDNKIDDQTDLEIQKKEKERVRALQLKQLELLKDEDSKYLPMNRFINSGRNR